MQLYFGQFFSVSFLTASKNWWKYAHLSGFLAASKNWWKYAHPYSFLAASKNCPKWLLHGRRGWFFSSFYWKIKAFKHEWGVGSPYMPPTKPIGCSETIWSWIQYIWYKCKRLHFGSSSQCRAFLLWQWKHPPCLTNANLERLISTLRVCACVCVCVREEICREDKFTYHY